MNTSARQAEPYVTYCRFTAIVFVLVAAYTVAVKVPSGELGSDWAHTALHLLTAAFAFYLGWVSPRAGPRLFTWGVVLVYGFLGAVGLLVDGIALGTPFRVPLRGPDNVFHLLLAGIGLAAGLRSER